MLSNETKELLEDFEKRMRFFNIMKYLTQRSCPGEIRDMFYGNFDVLDNVIVATLLYIMECTLQYGEKCTLGDVTSFLEEIAESFGFWPENVDLLAKYIIVDVLQNGGKVKTFDTFYSKEQQISEQTVRIISEENGYFKLTDEVYDFLFRTKEIDREMDFSVTRLKLNEFIRRGNYSKALRESRELVTKLRAIRTRMDDFILKCRTNVLSVSVDEYEEIILQVKYAFENEEKQLREIKKAVVSKFESFLERGAKGSLADDDRTEKEITEILANINTAINEQTVVYNKKFSLSDCYTQLLEDEFSYFSSKRFDFEKNILAPARQLDQNGALALSRLLLPLYKPEFPKHFSIAYFYEKQKTIGEREDGGLVDMSGAQDLNAGNNEKRNKRFVFIINKLFEFASSRELFCFSDFQKSLSQEDLSEMTQENALMNVMFKLYDDRTLPVKAWREGLKPEIEPLGEFDLRYCLTEIPGAFTTMDEILVTKCDNLVEFRVGNELKVFINDFQMKVIR